MIQRIFFTIFTILLAGSAFAANPFAETKDLPTAYQGRFRSLDSSARLWLHDLYHKSQLKPSDLAAFHTTNQDPLELIWKLHFFGHSQYDNSPLFWIHYADVKSLLNQNNTTERFSFQELSQAIENNSETNLQLMRYLIPYEFARSYHSATNRTNSEKFELSTLSPGLWTALRGDALTVINAPSISPWSFLKSGMILDAKVREKLPNIENQRKIYADEVFRLLQALDNYEAIVGTPKPENDPYLLSLQEMEIQDVPPLDISHNLENRFPLLHRLQKAGTTLKLLPSRMNNGEWLSLHALGIEVYHPESQQLKPTDNFTVFSDQDFHHIRNSYFALEKAAIQFYSKQDDSLLADAVSNFVAEYLVAYTSIARMPAKIATGKQLNYPSLWQLKAETLYHQLPLIEMTIGCYLLALLLILVAYSLKKPTLERLAIAILLIGFLLHTTVLGFRCFVLHRPPVSNMFETVIYVPWIAITLAFAFYIWSRSLLILSAACVASLALLILLKLTHIDARMENVQAVLDSQYWLIVHVLMVVGSYGAFAISGILGHYYLLAQWRKNPDPASLRRIAKGVLHTMYVGVLLLIPGTILGGVWAAESWGRFWDWDPKESWAFISACVYLLVIHAYTFNRIRDYGLAVGAIGGLVAISFTWYGVNYVLGTGLHSYGFGQGGEGYYFTYVAAEIIFIGAATFRRGAHQKHILKKPLE